MAVYPRKVYLSVQRAIEAGRQAERRSNSIMQQQYRVLHVIFVV